MLLVGEHRRRSDERGAAAVHAEPVRRRDVGDVGGRGRLLRTGDERRQIAGQRPRAVGRGAEAGLAVRQRLPRRRRIEHCHACRVRADPIEQLHLPALPLGERRVPACPVREAPDGARRAGGEHEGGTQRPDPLHGPVEVREAPGGERAAAVPVRHPQLGRRALRHVERDHAVAGRLQRSTDRGQPAERDGVADHRDGPRRRRAPPGAARQVAAGDGEAAVLRPLGDAGGRTDGRDVGMERRPPLRGERLPDLAAQVAERGGGRHRHRRARRRRRRRRMAQAPAIPRRTPAKSSGLRLRPAP